MRKRKKNPDEPPAEIDGVAVEQVGGKNAISSGVWVKMVPLDFTDGREWSYDLITGKTRQTKFPRNNPGKLSKAAAKFEEFTGLKATEAIRIDLPDAAPPMVILGKLVSVTYETEKIGEHPLTEWVHRFKKPLPLLLTDTAGNALFIAGGRFKINDRGIVG